MTVAPERLEFALKEVRASEWERFEQLCSVFLAPDFPGIHTMANSGGDRGRDAELYLIKGEANALFQFSVMDDWEQKIIATLKRLGEEFGSISDVVFMTSQLVGARGDKIKRTARTQGVSLDIRDRSWFVERMNADDSRSRAASYFARLIVDPLLEGANLLPSSSALKGQEAKTALIYLELQAKDEDLSKGLTRSCFESLVKAALQGTSADRRCKRDEIYRRVEAFLPQHTSEQLKPFVDGALIRMEKSIVKKYPKTEEYHLSFGEVEKTKDRVAALALLEDAFRSDTHDIVHNALEDDPKKLIKLKL